MVTIPTNMRWALFALVGAVYAQQTTSYSAAPSSTGSPTNSVPITHTIAVAQGGFSFTPNAVQALVGDIIEYQFYPTNHSVVRAEYGYPCIPYEDTGVDKVGFFSGFKPVDVILANPPTFSIRVNDSRPIFFYCSAPGSCILHQMVGVINPNATESLQTQMQLAANSSFMLQPGEPWPAEAADPFTTTTATPTPTSTSTSSTSSATAPAATTSAAAAASSSHSGLSGGAIAGIAIGAAAVAIIAAALLYVCGRQSRRSNDQPQMPPPSMPYSPATYMSQTPTKHMSGVTYGDGRSNVYASPALPGYVPIHDPAMSPPLRPSYANSEALVPASEIATPRSPALSDNFHAGASPAYMQPPAHGVHEMPGAHEMPAATEPQQGGAGMLNFIRNASTRKSGGVERYG